MVKYGNMSRKKVNSKSVLRNFFVFITSVCTIFSFFYIILGNDKWTEFVAYYFVISFAIFLLIVITLLGMFLFKLEPGIKDGRYLLLIIPSVFFLGSGYLYFKEYNPANKWGLIFLTVGLAITVITIVLTLFSWSTRTFTSSEDKDFIVNRISSKLVRLGDNKYEFDLYKDIQSRVPVLTVIDTRFKWTGDKVDSNMVKVTSVTHDTERIRVDDEGYDTIKLLFKSPLYYKQAFTCHYKYAQLTALAILLRTFRKQAEEKRKQHLLEQNTKRLTKSPLMSILSPIIAICRILIPDMIIDSIGESNQRLIITYWHIICQYSCASNKN